jgi:hypothetical protein
VLVVVVLVVVVLVVVVLGVAGDRGVLDPQALVPLLRGLLLGGVGRVQHAQLRGGLRHRRAGVRALLPRLALRTLQHRHDLCRAHLLRDRLGPAGPLDRPGLDRPTGPGLDLGLGPGLGQDRKLTTTTGSSRDRDARHRGEQQATRRHGGQRAGPRRTQHSARVPAGDGRCGILFLVLHASLPLSVRCFGGA